MLGKLKKAFNTTQLSQLKAYFTSAFASMFEPYSYYELVATMTQNSSSGPVLTIIKNDYGVTPSTLYDGVGTYRIVMTGAFVNNTAVLTTSTGGSVYHINASKAGNNDIAVYCFDASGTLSDDLIDGATIVIKTEK